MRDDDDDGFQWFRDVVIPKRMEAVQAEMNDLLRREGYPEMSVEWAPVSDEETTP